MPIGVMMNCMSVLLGGLIGSGLGKHIPERLRSSLPIVFGFVAISMGVMKIPSTDQISLVTLSVLLGTTLGEILQIDARLRRIAESLVRRSTSTGAENAEEASRLIVLAMVTFCMSGTGIFGALEEGVSGDAAILLSKSGLDFFTAILFASVAGKTIGLLSIPQAVLMLLLFLCGGAISPMLSEHTKAAFLSVGGVITLMNGCAMAKIADIRPANAIPSLVLVFIFSIVG